MSDDWVQLNVEAPAEVTTAVLAFLEREFGFRHLPGGLDWCVWEREQDFSHVGMAPCSPAGNRYTVDWRKGEGRGDVTVEIEPGRNVKAD
jgi:hypothetical protein